MPLRIAAVSIKGAPAGTASDGARLELLDRIVARIVSRGWTCLDAVVLPGGYFRLNASIGGHSRSGRCAVIDKTVVGNACKSFCRTLTRRSPGALIIAGADGPSMEQYCIAWASRGVAGLARKIFPTHDEGQRGFICYYDDFGCPARIVRLPSGAVAALCVCYDMFGLSEDPRRPGKRTACIRSVSRKGITLTAVDDAFRELRLGCIQQWDLLLRSYRPSVAIAAIHGFDRPGRDGFWQRHGIATASAALGGGVAVAAAHFSHKLPSPQSCTLAAASVSTGHLRAAVHRRAHRLVPNDATCIGTEAVVRLFCT